MSIVNTMLISWKINQTTGNYKCPADVLYSLG
jgi:hypothetical protein